MNTKRTGAFGERVAENYLKEKGYQILDRNFSFRIPGNPQKGELDIIAQKSGIISFIEVKTLRLTEFTPHRTCSGVGLAQGGPIPPEEKVNFSKQRKLRITAESWLMKKKIPLNSKWQIDVIAIEISPNKKAKISHFENAIPYA